MTKLKTIFFAASALALLGVSACKDPSDGTGGGTGAPPDAPFVEGGASLILSPDKLDITVKGTTADGTSVTVEGCTETTLISGIETVLHAKGSLVILKGKITSLDCSVNRLNSLNVQGLTALQVLSCVGNRLTELNVQGLTALQRLSCSGNRLTALNVQGLTSLQELWCSGNELTALDVQGLTALQSLDCHLNQLTALNVQSLTALQRLWCYGNRLTADAFKKLFDDLPVRADSDNASCYLYTEQTGDTEGNHTYFSAPSDLADAFNNAKTVKKWEMYKLNGSGNFSEI